MFLTVPALGGTGSTKRRRAKTPAVDSPRNKLLPLLARSGYRDLLGLHPLGFWQSQGQYPLIDASADLVGVDCRIEFKHPSKIGGPRFTVDRFAGRSGVGAMPHNR